MQPPIQAYLERGLGMKKGQVVHQTDVAWGKTMIQAQLIAHSQGNKGPATRQHIKDTLTVRSSSVASVRILELHELLGHGRKWKTSIAIATFLTSVPPPAME